MVGDAWKFQRIAQKRGDLPSQNTIKKYISSIRNLRDKALVSLLYITAGRVSEVLEITRESFDKTVKSNRNIVIIKLPNRKHKKRYYKEIPVPLDRKDNIFFLKVVEEYVNSSPGIHKLFPISKQRVWQILRKEIDMNPHYLRHIRLTHLVTMYDFREQQLILYAGWTDSRAAKHYMELKIEDVLERL